MQSQIFQLIILLAASSAALMPDIGQRPIALGIAAFLGYALVSKKFAQPEAISSQTGTDLEGFGQDYSIFALAATNPARLLHPEKMLRLSCLISLASPQKGSANEILYALNCLYDFLPQKIFLYFANQPPQLFYMGGIKPGQKKEIEIIPRADALVEETLQKMNSITEIRNLKKLCYSKEIFQLSTADSEPATCFVPVSFLGDFAGMMVAISPDGSIFSPTELSLLSFFAEQMAVFLDNQRLSSLQKEKTDNNSAKQLCNEIVRGILPEATPALPGWDLTFSHLRAADYGGDYFDFVQLPGGKLLVMIGKASGKGINAAIYFTRLQAMVRCLSGQFKTPADILNQLALLLGGDTNQELFATLLVVMLRPGSQEVIFAGAGHAAPMINRTRNGYVEIAGGESGIPLGLFSNSPNIYQNQTIQMLPGDGLFIYTDGILENHQQNGKQINVEKLKLKLEQLPEQTAAQMLEQLISEIISESGVSTNLPEDQTGLYLKVE